MTVYPGTSGAGDSPKCVMFVTHTSQWIGPTASLLQLVTRLPEHLSPLVAIPGPGRFSDALHENGIPSISFKRLDKYGIPLIAREMRRRQVDIVYGNSVHGVSRNALIAAKLCRLPFIYHLREMHSPVGRRKVRLFRWADATIAVSKATAESYRGLVRRPPVVVYNGVSLADFELSREECRRSVRLEFGIPYDDPIVIHVGNVYERKDQLLALRSVRDIIRCHPRTHLLLVGRLDRDEAYVERLRSNISEFDLTRVATITGFRDDVPRLLAGSDLLLHTARADPHPRAVIEGMAAGLPVLALSVDGVVETVEDEETGFLVDNAEALVDRLNYLLSSPDVRVTMGNRGRDRAHELFAAERTAANVARVITEVLDTT